MKIWMFMLVAGAAIAVAAPMANARELITEHSYLPHKTVTHVKTKGPKVTGSTKGRTSTKPLYIYVPGFSGGPGASPDPTELCLTQFENCTDQQLCENWSLNCSTAGDQSGLAQPASTDTSSVSLAASPQVVASALVEIQDATDSASVSSSSATDSSSDC